MDAIMKLAEATEPTVEEFDLTTIDQEKFKLFQSKCSIWEFNSMSRDEYINKSDFEKKNLIIIYYKHMVKGMLLFLFFRLSKLVSFSFFSINY